jgi:hypothetical protein
MMGVTIVKRTKSIKIILFIKNTLSRKKVLPHLNLFLLSRILMQTAVVKFPLLKKNTHVLRKNLTLTYCGKRHLAKIKSQ